MATTTTDAAGSDPIQNWLANGAGTEKARITSAGNVGIGTTGPATKLDVNGPIRTIAAGAPSSGSGLELNYNSGIGEANLMAYNRDGAAHLPLNIAASPIGLMTGNVGVGTMSPNALLDVRGNVIINEDGADKDVRIEGDTNTNLFFTDASTDRIGIGTNTPGALLDVRGAVIINEDGSNSDVRIEGDTDSNLFFTDASADSVGIGTASPARKLDVNGFAKFKTPAASVYKSSGTITINDPGTVLTFNSEFFDNDGLHSMSSNISRLTASETGVWMIIASVRWQLATETADSLSVQIIINGNTAQPIAADIRPGLKYTNVDEWSSCSGIRQMTAGDYVEILATAVTPLGRDQYVVGGLWGTTFMMYKISD